MDNNIEPELEVERLQSMHETVERLRLQLKTLQLAADRPEPRPSAERSAMDDLPEAAELTQKP